MEENVKLMVDVLIYDPRTNPVTMRIESMPAAAWSVQNTQHTEKLYSEMTISRVLHGAVAVQVLPVCYEYGSLDRDCVHYLDPRHIEKYFKSDFFLPQMMTESFWKAVESVFQSKFVEAQKARMRFKELSTTVGRISSKLKELRNLEKEIKELRDEMGYSISTDAERTCESCKYCTEVCFGLYDFDSEGQCKFYKR